MRWNNIANIISKQYLVFLYVLLCFMMIARPVTAVTAVGYTLHFDFINNWEQAKQIVTVAHDNGSEILNVASAGPYMGIAGEPGNTAGYFQPDQDAAYASCVKQDRRLPGQRR